MAFADATATPETAAPQARQVLFTPFTWQQHAKPLVPAAVDSGRVASFAAGVRDVAAGVRTVMQVIEFDDIEGDNDGGNGRPSPALLNVQHKADLLRMCTWALEKLERDSASMVDYLDEKAAP